jgi:hypothetical protein
MNRHEQHLTITGICTVAMLVLALLSQFSETAALVAAWVSVLAGMIWLFWRGQWH